MSFQTIINIQQRMNVNNRRVVGQQVSRAGYVTTAQYLTAVPWVFTVQPHAFLYYPQVRDVIQSIDNADRENPQNITFDTDNLAWFTEYQGELTILQAEALTLASTPVANSQTISVGNLPSVTSGTIVFKAGDFLQLGSYVYKVTANVLRGSLSTVSVNVHRPIIGTPTVGTLTAVGRNVIFPVVAESCPTYTLNPMTAGAFVEWNGEFVFREYIV
jgi:16S rRNA A1518/A1519 N6-dimethyltransferase RsmA/KsgA/DIM1 with predicted DNA glycosylase/AP lyase activity